jgi:CRP-like cAMP-binding protein
MQLYDHLLQFPLFQGMSRDNLSQVVGRTKFDFLKFDANRSVIKEGEACRKLYFLLSGTLCVQTFSADQGYYVVEQLSAPLMLQPESLFGYHQHYTHNYRALTPCSFIALEKSELIRLSEEYLVFRLNLLNLYSTMLQKRLMEPYQPAPATLAVRIVRFFCQRCVSLSGPKEFHVLMTRIADEVGDSRLDVSRALNTLQDDGLLLLHRGCVEIPQMEQLISHVNSR